MQVHTRSMTPELIHKSFSCTGIYPFNSQVFTNVDFAPARSFSTILQVPRSFPSNVPSSSPLSSDMSDLDGSESENQSDTDTEPGPDMMLALNLDWETDSNDSAYQLPLSDPPSSLSPGPAAPSTYISLPSILMLSMPPINTISSVLTHSELAELSEQSNNVPVDADSADTYSHDFSCHFTCPVHFCHP